MRYWKPEDIFALACPTCGEEVEFWKDEPVRICSGCQTELRNPRIDLGCAKWCQFAAECLGEGPAVAAILCDRLLAEMRRVFDGHEEMVEHTLQVLRHADEIRTAEGGDPLVAQAAAILHDIGIPEAIRKHGSAAGPFQEQEGPPIARGILERLGVEAGAIDHICRIVGAHHTGRDIDTPEFRIVWDADWLVNFPSAYGRLDRDAAEGVIEATFRTPTGRRMARRMHLGERHA